jgi:hypothetical protein
MIPQLVQRLVTAGVPQGRAAAVVLTADPLDLALHLEDVWRAYDPDPGLPPFPPLPAPARPRGLGRFGGVVPLNSVAWDHAGYAYVLENTRAVQIMRRVVREFRSGEGLGIASPTTRRWLDATEALLFGAANPIAPWLSTSTVRQDPEGIRRNLYWRLLGLDLAFGTDDNRPASYDKASAANTRFVALFEELLFELWRAISNASNLVGPNEADNDRIFRLAEAMQDTLRSRRQVGTLSREELVAATALGWIELTLSANTPIVIDLKAQATSAGDRLRLIGERVGLAPHSRSGSLFSMASELSIFLRVIEAGVVNGPGVAWVLYRDAAPAIGRISRRVITEWAAATGKDLKARPRPVEVSGRALRAVA